jgi:hypothetical protein
VNSPERVLTLRELNRATLARQMLLQRENISALQAVERVLGLQAQVTSPPYVGLWTRIEGFRREDLTRLMQERRVVRATLMRATLQLMSARDYLLLRPALQPALSRSMRSIAGKRLEGLDLDRLIGAAKEFFDEEPRTFADLRPLLSKLEPERDQSALAYAVRTRLPLVQVPSGGVWGYSGKAPFTTPERWLGGPPSGSEDPRALVLRYLAAFGPATVRDIQNATQAACRGDQNRAGGLPRRKRKRAARPPRRAVAPGRYAGPATFRTRLRQLGALPRRQGAYDPRRPS